MKKYIPVLLVIIIAAGGILLVTKKDNKKNDNTNVTATTSNQRKSKAACELLTLEDARSLLGTNAAVSEGSGEPTNATADGVTVDVCSYSADGATLGETKQLTIQSHFGDQAQVKAAYENFLQAYPGEEIPGLGDAAFYSTEAKQVHVRKGDYWLFAGGGSVNDGGNRELEEQALKMALQKL